MKNKLIKAFSIIALMLLMSGCVKYNVNMKITNDKKMEMELIVATTKSLLQGEGNEDGSVTMTEDTEAIENLEKDGWKVSDYEDDEYKGSKLSKSFKNIDDVSTTSETELDLNSLFEEGKNSKYIFYKKTENGKTIYVAKFKANVDTSSMNQVDDESTNGMTAREKEEYQKQMEEMSKQVMKTMDLKITVEVPNVISNNATEVNGNKLTWDLTKLESGKNIEFEFELKGNSFPIIPVAIGGGVLLLVIIIVLVLSKKKGNKPETIPTMTENMAPIPEMVGPMGTASTPEMANPMSPIPAPEMANPMNSTPTSEMTNPMNTAPSPDMMVDPLATPTTPSIEPAQPVVEPQMTMPSMEPAQPVVEPQMTIPSMDPEQPVVEPQMTMPSMEPAQPVVEPQMTMPSMETQPVMTTPEVPAVPAISPTNPENNE